MWFGVTSHHLESFMPSPANWSLTTKISAASALLCILCVSATCLVLGLQASHVAHTGASERAAVTARETAAQVGGEL